VSNSNLNVLPDLFFLYSLPLGHNASFTLLEKKPHHVLLDEPHEVSFQLKNPLQIF
jgi:hypothetical protein